MPLKQSLHRKHGFLVSFYHFSEYIPSYHLGESLNRVLPGVLASSPFSLPVISLQPCSHWTRVHHQFRRTYCLCDRARESQSTGDSEIRWVTSTKAHVTQLAWHGLKAFSSTQQTWNGPCSSCFPLPIVPPSHLKPQSFVFTILSLFLLRFLVFHPRLYSCFLEKQGHILSGQLTSLLCLRAKPSGRS